MKYLILPLLAAIALPTAVNAESYWLTLYFGDNTFGSMEKVEMESAEACNKEGSKWENTSTIKKSKIYRSFHCVVGK